MKKRLPLFLSPILMSTAVLLAGCSPTLSEQAATEQVAKENELMQMEVDNTNAMVNEFEGKRNGMRQVP